MAKTAKQILSIALAFLLAFGTLSIAVPVSANAAITDTLVEAINNYAHGGTGTLHATADIYHIGTITVTGSVTGATNPLILNMSQVGGGGSGGSSSSNSSDSSTSPSPDQSIAPVPVNKKPAAIEKFNDVKVDDWYAESVAFVVERGLFNGTSATEFSPNTQMTRGMLVTVLAKLAGETTDGGEMWYSKAAEWGFTRGITDGNDIGSEVTREQIVTMLFRYANPTTGAFATRINFGDVADISEWANEAVMWASTGIITGYPDSTFKPQNQATRAEIATIIARFYEKYSN
jgi:hypothetical protein